MTQENSAHNIEELNNNIISNSSILDIINPVKDNEKSCACNNEDCNCGSECNCNSECGCGSNCNC